MTRLRIPTTEQVQRWGAAMTKTWNCIGSDCIQCAKDCEEPEPTGWVVVELTLDADHILSYGGLTKEDYADFNAWVLHVMAQYKSAANAYKKIAEILHFHY